MKLLTKITSISLLSLCVLGAANAKDILISSDDYVTSNLCVTAAQGNKAKLGREIRKAHLSKTIIVEDVTCNGLNFVAFVEKYGTNVYEINDYLTHGKYSTLSALNKEDDTRFLASN
jgi:hypothetical protein